MAHRRTHADRLMKARRYAGFSRQEFGKLMGHNRHWVTDHEVGLRGEPVATTPGETAHWLTLCGLGQEWLEIDAWEAVKAYAQWQRERREAGAVVGVFQRADE